MADARRADPPVYALWFVFGVVFAAGLVFRLAVIDEAFWYDETISATRYFSSSPIDIISTSHPNNHPLYSLTVRMVWGVLGESETAARAPALVAWLWVLAMLVWLGRRLFSSQVGWLAAILGVLAFWQVRYSIEARGNMMATALGMAAIIVLIVGLENHRKPLVVASAVLLAVATLAHLYAAALVVGILAIWLAARVRSWRDLKDELPSMVLWAGLFGGLMVLLYLPAQNLIKVAGSLILRGEAPYSGALAQPRSLSLDYLLEVSRGYLSGIATVGGAVLLIVPYGLGLWAARRRPIQLSVLAIPPLVLAAATATMFLFFERFLIVAQPFALLGVAVGIDSVARSLVGRRPVVAALAGAATVLAITLIPNGGFPEALPIQVRQWDHAAAYIDANGPSLVVANPLDGSFSPVRDSLGYYLRDSTIVEPLQGEVRDGSEVFYVRRAAGVSEDGLEMDLGEPVEFGEVMVFRQVWKDGGLVPAP